MGGEGMKAVFMSASVPDPTRPARYYSTADVVGIREAVRALAEVVISRERLVFGGHPAITPLIRHVAERVGYSDRITIYQSDYFRTHFPSDNAFFRNMVVVPEVAGDLRGSLLAMRKAMMTDHDFRAGVFIGGMEGIEEEYELFERLAPRSLRLPVASTGAASKLLLKAHAANFDPAVATALETDLVYAPMFERLLGYAGTP